MESNFHSTVLQRPTAMHDYDEERDRDRDRDRDERRRRDILNPIQLSENGPAAPSAANPNAPPARASSSSSSAQPPRHAFNLRSPTQPDFHGPHFPGASSASPSSASAANPSAAAPNSTANANGTTSRSGLHNPFLTSAAPSSLPPAAAPPRSPLHAPPHLFYPQDMRDARDQRDPPRNKTVSNFYDPTTDTTTTTATSDRRVSDAGTARHPATQSQASASKVSEPIPHVNDNDKDKDKPAWNDFLVCCIVVDRIIIASSVVQSTHPSLKIRALFFFIRKMTGRPSGPKLPSVTLHPLCFNTCTHSIQDHPSRSIKAQALVISLFTVHSRPEFAIHQDCKVPIHYPMMHLWVDLH